MTFKPNLLLKYMASKEQKFQKYRFFQLLCEQIFQARFTTNQVYVSRQAV